MTRASLFALIFAVQLVCAVFFIYDIVITVFGLTVVPIDWQVHEMIELGAALGLVLGVIVGAYALQAAHRRSARIEDNLRVASGAFNDLLQERFAGWALTPAERDVALFLIKGLGTADIARMRSTSEGTVKAQTNAIYRKAGVSGRSQLLSLFLEDLMAEELVPARS